MAELGTIERAYADGYAAARAEIERLRAVPEAAAKEIEAYVAETVKRWVNFHGHESEIAAIIRKHAGATPEQRAATTRED